ncbi:hypothetical protein RVR_2914 [Actinacidiphila reveromycinica]|uniref:SnoaL-like domain-containing protein n=1 Tax=Actinacidiphila reveromycinica TaxID=659352 RepID=A0A7U3VN46_9ACTN|nr:nuclear transport factor 2 family protein [Streptomyces sp. SN-593]BBA97257.1 hypothetical protein RVR_2914 [Streptomyces sp. SN-593]
MARTAQEADALRRLADRMDVRELVDRYLAGLDEGRFDDTWARSVFTEDGRFEVPTGGHDGVAGMAEATAAMIGRWRSTHHLAAGHLVEIDGDRARVRGSLVVTHLYPPGAVVREPAPRESGPRKPGPRESGLQDAPGRVGAPDAPGAPEPFQVGDRFEGAAVRTGAGWRFARLAFEVVWTRGTPPGRVEFPHP